MYLKTENKLLEIIEALKPKSYLITFWPKLWT